ncbi:MFS transporter [Paenibacillus wulumuqiensis]|uniref:MFS transporter n=1 Tax=Paenibacillus wulumuqiensis TaxID=1567107 RepID=UPI000619FACE|nr:MFS transporter [Paenibacillus wulumuqiensis]
MNMVLVRLWPVYLAYALSQFGNWAFRAGFVYALYDQQNGSNSVLGWTIVLVYVPVLLGGKLLSPWTDRFDSRRTLIWIDISRAVLLLPLLFIHDFANTGVVVMSLVVVMILSLFTPVFSSAQSVYIRKQIDEEHITPALAVISNLDWLCTLIGTMCGPLLLIYLDFQKIVMIDLLTFIASILIFYALLQKNTGGKQAPQTAASAQPEAAPAGKLINLAVLSIFFLNLGAGVINLYPNVIARNVYGVGEIGLSYVYLANGLGGLLGALLIAQLRKKFQLLHIVGVASLCIALSLFLMGLLNQFVVSIVASSLMLLFGQLFGVGVHSYLLKNNPVSQTGRITGLFMYATFSGVALNAILFATLLSSASVGVLSLFLTLCAVSAGVSAVLLLIYVLLKSQAEKREQAVTADPVKQT